MSAFNPVDVRAPDDRRKKLLQMMMAKAQGAGGASRPGSFLAAAGHSFKGTGVGPRPNVTHGSNVAQSVLQGLGITGHSYDEEVSPGNGMPITPPHPITPNGPPPGPPIPVNPGNGGGGPAAGGGPAVAPPPTPDAAPVVPTSVVPQNIINTGSQSGFDAASSALVHLGGGWVFDPNLGKTYQLPGYDDGNYNLGHGAV